MTYLCDPADLAFVGGAVAGSRQRALLNRTSTVQRDKRGGAQVEWIVGIVVQLVGVCEGLLTGCQNLAGLDGEERFNRTVRDEMTVIYCPFKHEMKLSHNQPAVRHLASAPARAGVVRIQRPS